MGKSIINELQLIPNFNFAALANLGQRYSQKGDSIINANINILDILEETQSAILDNYTNCYAVFNAILVDTFLEGEDDIDHFEIHVWGINSDGIYVDISETEENFGIIYEPPTNEGKLLSIVFSLLKKIYDTLTEKEIKNKEIYFPFQKNNTRRKINNTQISFNSYVDSDDPTIIFQINNILVEHSSDTFNNSYYVYDEWLTSNRFYVYDENCNDHLSLFYISNPFIFEENEKIYDYEKGIQIFYDDLPYLNESGHWVINGNVTQFSGLGIKANQPHFILQNDLTHDGVPKIISPKEYIDKINFNLTSTKTNIKIKNLVTNTKNENTEKWELETVLLDIDSVIKSGTYNISDFENALLIIVSNAENVTCDFFNDSTQTTVKINLKDKYGCESITTFWEFNSYKKLNNVGALEEYYEFKPIEINDKDGVLTLNYLTNIEALIEYEIEHQKFKTDSLKYNHINFGGIKTQIKNDATDINDEDSKEIFFNFKILNANEAYLNNICTSANEYNKFNMVLEISDGTESVGVGTEKEVQRGIYRGNMILGKNRKIQIIKGFTFSGEEIIDVDPTIISDVPILNSAEFLYEHFSSINRINILGIPQSEATTESITSQNIKYGYLGLNPSKLDDRESLYLGAIGYNIDLGKRTLQNKDGGLSSMPSFSKFINFILDFPNFSLGEIYNPYSSFENRPDKILRPIEYYSNSQEQVLDSHIQNIKTQADDIYTRAQNITTVGTTIIDKTHDIGSKMEADCLSIGTYIESEPSDKFSEEPMQNSHKFWDSLVVINNGVNNSKRKYQSEIITKSNLLNSTADIMKNTIYDKLINVTLGSGGSIKSEMSNNKLTIGTYNDTLPIITVDNNYGNDSVTVQSKTITERVDNISVKMNNQILSIGSFKYNDGEKPLVRIQNRTTDTPSSEIDINAGVIDVKAAVNYNNIGEVFNTNDRVKNIISYTLSNDVKDKIENTSKQIINVGSEITTSAKRIINNITSSKSNLKVVGLGDTIKISNQNVDLININSELNNEQIDLNTQKITINSGEFTVKPDTKTRIQSKDIEIGLSNNTKMITLNTAVVDVNSPIDFNNSILALSTSTFKGYILNDSNQIKYNKSSIRYSDGCDIVEEKDINKNRYIFKVINLVGPLLEYDYINNNIYQMNYDSVNREYLFIKPQTRKYIYLNMNKFYHLYLEDIISEEDFEDKVIFLNKTITKVPKSDLELFEFKSWKTLGIDEFGKVNAFGGRILLLIDTNGNDSSRYSINMVSLGENYGYDVIDASEILFEEDNETVVDEPDITRILNQLGCGAYGIVKYKDAEQYTGFYAGGKKPLSAFDQKFRNNQHIINLDRLQYFKNLTLIGEEEFKDCMNLNSISLPRNLERIDKSAFENTGLVHINFDENQGVISKIGTAAFKDCRLLTNIKLPSYVNRIEGNAFENSSISSITLPSELKELGSEIFKGCNMLEEVTLPPKLGSIGFDLFNNSSIKTINFNVFNNVNLEDCKCPEVETISARCANEVKISTKPDSTPNLKNLIFDNKYNNVDNLYTSFYENKNRNCIYKQLALGSDDPYTIIKGSSNAIAFGSCPRNIDIGDGAFAGIMIGTGIVDFNGRKGLLSQVRNIGKDAFKGANVCSELEDRFIQIGSNIDRIGIGAFNTKHMNQFIITNKKKPQDLFETTMGSTVDNYFSEENSVLLRVGSDLIDDYKTFFDKEVYKKISVGIITGTEIPTNQITMQSLQSIVKDILNDKEWIISVIRDQLYKYKVNTTPESMYISAQDVKTGIILAKGNKPIYNQETFEIDHHPVENNDFIVTPRGGQAGVYYDLNIDKTNRLININFSTSVIQNRYSVFIDPPIIGSDTTYIELKSNKTRIYNGENLYTIKSTEEDIEDEFNIGRFEGYSTSSFVNIGSRYISINYKKDELWTVKVSPNIIQINPNTGIILNTPVGTSVGTSLCHNNESFISNHTPILGSDFSISPIDDFTGNVRIGSDTITVTYERDTSKKQYERFAYLYYIEGQEERRLFNNYLYFKSDPSRHFGENGGSSELDMFDVGFEPQFGIDCFASKKIGYTPTFAGTESIGMFTRYKIQYIQNQSTFQQGGISGDVTDSDFSDLGNPILVI